MVKCTHCMLNACVRAAITGNSTNNYNNDEESSAEKRRL